MTQVETLVEGRPTVEKILAPLELLGPGKLLFVLEVAQERGVRLSLEKTQVVVGLLENQGILRLGWHFRHQPLPSSEQLGELLRGYTGDIKEGTDKTLELTEKGSLWVKEQAATIDYPALSDLLGEAIEKFFRMTPEEIIQTLSHKN